MKPSIEEVKEKFKDAEIVESCYNNEFVIGKIKEYDDEYEATELEKQNSYHTIWNEDSGYAKILTYKTPKFEITKEQVLSLHHHGHDLTKTQIQGIFPEVFKKELVVGKWHKVKGRNIIFCLFENGIYGFLNGVEKTLNWEFASDESLEDATPQEVESALIREAKKKYIKGVSVICLEDGKTLKIDTEYKIDFENNCLWYGGVQVLNNGIWATIIETITIQEAEKLLNKKIV